MNIFTRILSNNTLIGFIICFFLILAILLLGIWAINRGLEAARSKLRNESTNYQCIECHAFYQKHPTNHELNCNGCH